MTSVQCDHCNDDIRADDCVYRIQALDPTRIDRNQAISTTHLHYHCIVPWVNS
jgi:hypothetical protein